MVLYWVLVNSGPIQVPGRGTQKNEKEGKDSYQWQAWWAISHGAAEEVATGSVRRALGRFQGPCDIRVGLLQDGDECQVEGTQWGTFLQWKRVAKPQRPLRGWPRECGHRTLLCPLRILQCASPCTNTFAFHNHPVRSQEKLLLATLRNTSILLWEGDECKFLLLTKHMPPCVWSHLRWIKDWQYTFCGCHYQAKSLENFKCLKAVG